VIHLADVVACDNVIFGSLDHAASFKGAVLAAHREKLVEFPLVDKFQCR